MNSRIKKGSALSWSIWALAVFFLFYDYILRIFPAAMVGSLMQAFQITAGQLGLLSAFYFYAYAPMQIPVGLLMDRFGARNLLFFAAAVCSIGSCLFGASFSFVPAAFGRFLMGLGSAFAFVGMIYVSSHWFPKRQRALLVGIGNSIGMFGAAGALGPLTLILADVHWRLLVTALGVIGGILALCLFFFIRKDHKRPVEKEEIKDTSLGLLSNLKIVCSNRFSWINAFVSLLFYMTTAAFASLWGVPFLIRSHQLSNQAASFMIGMVFVGWIFGGPLIGWISDRMDKRKPIIYFSILATLATLMPVIYLTNLPSSLLFILLFLIGFFSSGELLNFSLAIEVNPIEAKGTSIALTNFIIAAGSSAMQPLIGWLLDFKWDGALQNGVPIYTLSAYRFALTSFPITLILAFILLLFLKEGKHGKEKEIFSP